jgi:transcriptional regulator GlxA family with amidase domain
MGELAAQLDISRSTLYAYFRQVLGRTPQEALDEIRLKHAIFLLKHSDRDIASVARGSGFCSSSHLGRKLRVACGRTATEIRASAIGCGLPTLKSDQI